MNKIQFKKIGWSILGTLSIAVAPATLLSFNPKEQKQFVFDNRIFNSQDEAYHYLIQNQKINTSQLEVVGDLSKSYANAETGQLNKSLLPTFNPQQAEFYYFNAGGGITKDYGDAKNSYYNPGRIRTMYSDNFSKKLFLSEAQAKQSLEGHKMEAMVPFYNVDFIDKVNNPSISNSKLLTITTKVNPFNQKDIDAFKENIKQHTMDIIMSNIMQDKTGTGEYEVDFHNKGKNAYKNVGFNLAQYILDQNQGFTYDESNKKISKSNEYTTPNVKWEGPRKQIGTNGEYDDDKYLSVHFGSHKLTSHVSDYGSSWFDWVNEEYNNISRSELLELINIDKKSDWLKNKSNKKITNIDLQDNKQDFINKLMKIKSQLNTFKIKAFLQQKGSPLANGPLSSYYINEILSKLKSFLGNLILNAKVDFSFNTNNIYFYPSMHKEIYWHWYSAWDKNEYIWTNGSSNIHINYDSTTKSSISNDLTNVKLANNNGLLNYLSDWSINNLKKITIKKQGHPLFDINLKVDSNKGIDVDSIKLAEGKSSDGKLVNINQANVLAKSSNKNVKNLFKYYSDFYNGLVSNKIQHNIFSIFDKYFKDENILDSKLNIDYRYKGKLESKTGKLKIIDEKEILQVYLTMIKNAYDHYRSEGNISIFENIKDNLISPKNILVWKYKNLNGKSFNPFLAKYSLKSISSFNTKVSSGVFEEDNHTNSIDYNLALDDPAWRILKNKSSNDFPTQILVAYDNNGQRINADGYQYDDEALLEFNIKLRLEPRKDIGHIFMKGHSPLANELHKIYCLKIESKNIYFDKFKNLQDYVYNYLTHNSYSL